MTRPTDPDTTTPSPGAIADVLPLGPLQEGLLFHHALSGGTGDAYGIQLRMELLGRVDPERLRTAASALLTRHPNLRAGFLYEELDRPVQFVPAVTELDWTHTDLSTEEDPARAEDGVAEEEFGRGFDLAAPPLVRFHALTTGPGRLVLVITAHHVLLDGWSLPILARDLLGLYAADGDGNALPSVPRYRDHLAWIGSRDHEAGRRAWSTALEGLSEPTLIAPAHGHPAEEPGSAAVPPRPTRIRAPLGADLDRGLRSLAAEKGVTVNTVLQTVWALALSTHTGRHDVVFGQPVSGRGSELPGAQDTVGLFTNTLPVRIALDPAESLSDLLTRVHLDRADLLDHQWTGLAEIQRATGHGTLFDTLLVVENYPLDEAVTGRDHAGVRAGRIRVRDATHYPVTLTVTPGEEGGDDALLYLDHRDEAVPTTIARGLLDLVLHLLDQVLADPDRPVRALDLIAPSARAAFPGPDTSRHTTEHTDALAPLAEAERAHPDRTAVVSAERSLTYRELHTEAARLARLLTEHGAGAETVVAVALPRGADLIVAIVAALRCGGTYLPLDLDHPPARLADMAERAGATLVLTTSERRGALADLPDTVVRIELDDPDTRARAAALDPLPWAAPHPEHLAYVLFTSGSTGRPKGVGVPHRAIANRIEWTQGAYRLTPEDRIAHKTPVGFDVSVWEFLWPLSTGASIVVARPDDHRDPARLIDLFARERVTVCHFVPAVLRLFVDELATAPTGLPDLRLLIASGEALTLDLARDLGAALPSVRLENLYGPTEAAIDVTAHGATGPGGPDLDLGDPSGTVPIGRPVWNTTAHVLDDSLRPVPPEAPGELYLGGVQVARGYVGRPDLTASRFVADPYGPPGSRLYRTGDLVRRLDDGSLVHLGRSDDQVKINGVRIEPAETEAVLRALTGVAEAAVTVRTDAAGAATLAGYLVPVPGTRPDTDDLRGRLASALPPAAVPATLTVLDRMPLSVNGKVDRGALPEPEPLPVGGRGAATDAERLLCAAIADLLGREPESVGADADFFALGGDSVTSIRLVGRARAGGLEFTVRDVFIHRTAERLAAHAAGTVSEPAEPEPGPEPGDEFAGLLDAGEMDDLQRLWEQG